MTPNHPKPNFDLVVKQLLQLQEDNEAKKTTKELFESVLSQVLSRREDEIEAKATLRIQQKMIAQQEHAQQKLEAAHMKLQSQQQQAQARQDLLLERIHQQQQQAQERHDALVQTLTTTVKTQKLKIDMLESRAPPITITTTPPPNYPTPSVVVESSTNPDPAPTTTTTTPLKFPLHLSRNNNNHNDYNHFTTKILTFVEDTHKILSYVNQFQSTENEELNRIKRAWRKIAIDVYSVRSANYKSNFAHVMRVFDMSEAIVRPLLAQCPEFPLILCHILENKFGFRIRTVDWRKSMSKWNARECGIVGASFATFLRKRKTADAAVAAWRAHYVQLNELFTTIPGFEDFLLNIAENTLRDSIYGTVYRVSVGAFLSMLDATTDIFVITTYYRNGLPGRALALLSMISLSMIFQIVTVIGSYQNKSWAVKMKEILICLTFLRPAVDAFRVSTNYKDDGTTLDPLMEMVTNKVCELAAESIPGAVLQFYVYLTNPKQAGSFALVSIGISALTTGFTSAMIAFDFDVDAYRRRNQQAFYGYVPNDNGLRGRCFTLMTCISALHNISRSVATALLSVRGGGKLVMAFVGVEVLVYFAFKIFRGDWWWHPRNEGFTQIIVAPVARLLVKIIVDFSGCLHMRHPFEMGGAAFSASMLWAQVMPFIALAVFEEGEDQKGLKGTIAIGLIGCFSAWVVLNGVFFCTIDLGYLGTFFSTTTAPEYTCQLWAEAKDDSVRWDAVFTNNINYTKAVHAEVKLWIAANVDEWKVEKPKWFAIEKIPDEFLPVDAFMAEGGFNRRRSSVGVTTFRKKKTKKEKEGLVHPEPESTSSWDE